MSSANNGSDGCCTVIKSTDENGALNGSYQQMTSRPDSSPGPPSPDGPLNYSSNVLLVYRLNEMRHMENVNFVLALACLVYW